MQNLSLQILDLSYAGIGDNAMHEIAEGIGESIHLYSIDLRHNHFEKEGLHSLIKALKKTMVCSVLKLEGIFFDEEDADLLGTFLTDSMCKI